MATSVSAKVPPRRRRTPSLADPCSFSSSRDILRRCAFATCPGAPSHLPPLSSGQGILPYAEGAGGGLQYGDLGGRPMSLWVDKRSRLNLAARAFRARRSDRGTKSPLARRITSRGRVPLYYSVQQTGKVFRGHPGPYLQRAFDRTGCICSTFPILGSAPPETALMDHEQAGQSRVLETIADVGRGEAQKRPWRDRACPRRAQA